MKKQKLICAKGGGHSAAMPYWTFGFAVLFAGMLALFLSFAGVNTAGVPASTGPFDVVAQPAQSCTQYCDGWYYCGSLDHKCCHKWHTYCGGSDQPPTISAALLCSWQGTNGWCLAGAQLSLTTSDPQGYSVTISGTLNSTPFTCGSSCTLDLPQGTGTANYTATSSTSGLTATGSTNWASDPIAPSLTLDVVGTLGANGWYIAPVTVSATAADSISGILYVQYSVDGGAWQYGTDVTLSSDGSHTVIFRAMNNAGWLANARQSIKIDQTHPALSMSITAGTRGSSNWYVSPVTVSATASDATSGIGAIQYSLDGGPVTSGSSVTISTDGNHTVVFSATDQAGNATATPQSFKIDQTKPALSVSITTGTLGSNDWYVSPVTLTASASDATSGIASVQYSLDGGAWTSGSSVTLSSDGSHNVAFAAQDNAGNTTVLSQAVKIDQTKPVITLTPTGTNGSNGWYISDVNVAISVSDAASGVQSSSYSVDGGAAVMNANGVTAPLSDGQHTISVTATDQAGNIATQNLSLKIDTVAPFLSAAIFPTIPDGTNGWYKSPVALAAAATDSGSGVASIDHQLDGGTWISGAGFTVSSDGSHTVLFRATDQAGNTATLNPLAFQIKHTFQIDQTPPQITFTTNGTQGANGWYTSAVNATIHVTDPTSGTLSSQYSVDGGAAQSNADGVAVPFSDGLHTISVNATDEAGNSDTQILNLKIDTIAPTLSVAVNPASPNGTNNWYTVPITLKAAASDTGSGMDTVEYQVDGGAWTTGSSLTLTSDGNHTVSFRATDLAGNRVVSSTQSFQLDQTAPSSSFLSPASASLQSGTFLISGTSSDSLSGLASSQISFDNRLSWTPLTLNAGTWSYSWDSSTQQNGSHTLSVRATDLAGNIEKPVELTVTLDNHPPLISLTPFHWLVSGSGSLSVQPNGFPLQSAAITIGDPSHRWADIVQTYDAAHIPSAVGWDGLFAHKVQAPYGEYYVIVRACDVNQVCGSTNGKIVIPTPILQYLPPVIQGLFPTPVPIVPAIPFPTEVAEAGPMPMQTILKALPVQPVQSNSPAKENAGQSSASSPSSPALPWALMAVAAMAGVTAYSTTKKTEYKLAPETASVNVNSPATQVLDETPPPPTPPTGAPNGGKKDKTVTYNGLTLEQLSKYYQHQLNESDCGPTSIAMGTNLINSNPNGIKIASEDSNLEQEGLKVSGVGIPTWPPFTTDALGESNPNSTVAETSGASISDLKQALKAGNIVVVTVSWQTNIEVVEAWITHLPTPVGHYMVLVGYDNQKLYFLDPGWAKDLNHPNNPTGISTYSYSDFKDIWKTKSNFAIQSGTMYTISKKGTTPVQTGAGDAIGNAIKEVDTFEANTIAAIGNSVGDGVMSVAALEVNGTKAAGNAIGNGVEAATTVVAKITNDVGAAISTGIETTANSVASSLINLGRATNNAAVENGTNKAAMVIKTGGTAISNGVKAAANNVADETRNIGTAISNGVKSAGNAMANVTTSVGTAISNGVKATTNLTATSIKVAGNLMGYVAKNAVHTMTSIAKGAVKTATNAAKGAAKTAKYTTRRVTKTVTNTVKRLTKTFTTATRSVVNGVSTAARSVAKAVSNTVKSVVNGVSTAARSVAKAATNTVKSVVQSVQNGWNKVKSWFHW